MKSEDEAVYLKRLTELTYENDKLRDEIIKLQSQLINMDEQILKHPLVTVPVRNPNIIRLAANYTMAREFPPEDAIRYIKWAVMEKINKCVERYVTLVSTPRTMDTDRPGLTLSATLGVYKVNI